MKTFKTTKWDADASRDNTYEELFKRVKSDKNKEKKKESLPILKTGDTDRKQKRILKKLLKKRYKDLTSRKLIKSQLSNEHFIKDKDKVLKNHGNHFKLISGKEMAGDYKGEKRKESKNDPHIRKLKNGITKNQPTSLEKYSSKLSVPSELYTEKQKETLKRLIENARGKQVVLNNANPKVKHRFEETKKAEQQHKTRKKEAKLSSDQKASNYVKDTHNENQKGKSEYLTSSSSKNNKINELLQSIQMKKKQKLHEKLERLKALVSQEQAKKAKPILTLRQKMMEKLKAARFRFLNEQIYTTSSKEAQKIFKSDPDAFTAYHEGYRQQVRSWPFNPLDIIIKSIKKMPNTHIVADLGCGDARLAKSVQQKVHSFDLVAVDDNVVACDMSKVPLEDNSVDVAVFCLSLMGTNLQDYISEANRILKLGGLLKIAEVQSRFEGIDNFIEAVQRFGFKKTWKDLTHNLFYFIDFKKQNNVKNKNKLPTISLLPCLYKKR